MEKIDGPKTKSNDAYVGSNRYISDKKAVTIAAVMVGAGMLFGGLGIGASYRMAEREAAQNPLELTCEQLSERDTSVKGLDGNTYKILCEDYKVPAVQEGEE